jgi:predicted ester cyclase
MDKTNHVARDFTRQAIELFYHAHTVQDVELLRTVVTPDWEYVPPSFGSIVGPDQMVPVFADLTLALPDMKITVLDVLVHGNMVGVRARVSGTQSGPLKGIPPTSKPIEFAIHSFHEFRDGRIAKTWHLEDWLSVFHQLGELPPSLKK